METKISLCKAIEVDSKSENLFLKKIHQASLLNSELKNNAVNTWDDVKKYTPSKLDIEKIITEKANKFIERENRDYKRRYLVPDLVDTMKREIFEIIKVSIEVLCHEIDNLESSKLRCYFNVDNLILLNSFGKYLLVRYSENNSNPLIYTIELGQGLAITSYEK